MAAEVPQAQMEQMEQLFDSNGVSRGGLWKALKDKVWLLEAVKEEDGKIHTRLATGVCVHSRGLILSCSHVFGDGYKIYGRTFGKVFRSDIKVLCRKGDLVLLAVGGGEISPYFDFNLGGSVDQSDDDIENCGEPERFECIELATKGELNVQDCVATIAHGNHLNFAIAYGKIKSECLPCEYEPHGGLLTSEIVSFIKIGFELGEGSSGAPVVDRYGRLVGMIVSGVKDYQFAVHIGFVRKFCDYFIVDPNKEEKKAKEKREKRVIAKGKNWSPSRN